MESVQVIDPIKFARMCWPWITFYKEQKKVIYSVIDNVETYVPAGNELGKDFVSSFIALWFFRSRSPCKLVTTSPQAGQLEDVLWGEIRRLLDSSKYDLKLDYKHMKIRQVREDGTYEPRSELVGRVVQKGESLLGRHIERGPLGLPMTMIIFDEASGVDDYTYNSSDTWSHRKLIIGNPYPCTNFFYRGVTEGDKPLPEGMLDEGGLLRKVITIKGEASPNVRLALAQKEAGVTVTHETLVPGVLTYHDYVLRRAVWDKMKQCIGLDAEFYEGDEVMLYPLEWRKRAIAYAASKRSAGRRPICMGVDSAEGGDSSSWALGDYDGLIELDSMKTPDTTFIVEHTIYKIKTHNLRPENVYFDRGGGGKQHADRLRKLGYNVKTVSFGERVSLEKKTGRTILAKRKEIDEQASIYKNRRAQMYGLLSQAMNPGLENNWGIPCETEAEIELHRQLSKIPLKLDEEGKMYMLPKRGKGHDDKQETLTKLLGRSPDEADAVVLLAYGLFGVKVRPTAGAVL